MRIGKVIGKVTLSENHPSFNGASLRLVVPLELENLPEGDSDSGEFLVAWDELSAGEGSLVAVSEGPEAAQPFRPEIKPVDAYVAALLDSINLTDNMDLTS